MSRHGPHLFRTLGIALALGATLLLGAGCERTGESSKLTGPPIRVGTYYWPGLYWVDIAHRNGWFREAGLNVEPVDTNPDYFGSFDQFFAGKLDVIGFTQFDFIQHNALGKRAVGFIATDYSKGAEALVARPGIGSLRELAGRKLALTKGTYLEYLWHIAAQRAGLKADAVQLVDVPGEKAHELLARGEADAILTWEPFVSQGLAAVKGTKLFDTSEVAGVLWTVFSATPEFVAKRGANIQDIVGVWQRTTQYIRQKPDEAYAIVAEVNRKTVAEVREFARKNHVLDLRENLTAFSYAAGFDSLHGSTRQMNDFIVQRGIAQKRLDTGELFDSRFVRALQGGSAKP